MTLEDYFKFTIQNVSIKSPVGRNILFGILRFTIQNVSIKFSFPIKIVKGTSNLQYKMFLLNIIHLILIILAM